MKASTYLWIGLGVTAVGAAAFFMFGDQIKNFASGAVSPGDGSNSPPRLLTPEEAAIKAQQARDYAAQSGVQLTLKTADPGASASLRQFLVDKGFYITS